MVRCEGHDELKSLRRSCTHPSGQEVKAAEASRFLQGCFSECGSSVVAFVYLFVVAAEVDALVVNTNIAGDDPPL